MTRQALAKMQPVPFRSLFFILTHLHKVADDPRNKMGVKNLATVFSPSLVSAPSTSIRLDWAPQLTCETDEHFTTQ